MAGRRILTLVALVVCLASGCSDTDSPSDAPDPPSTSDSPNDSPSEQTEPVEADVDAPTMPGGASKDTLKGAEAFVRHYIALLNYATATGRIRALHKAARGCKNCRNYEHLYAQTYARGGYMHYSGWKPTDVQAFDTRGKYVVLVTVHAPRIRYRLTRDSEPKIGPSARYKLRFAAQRRAGGWVITDLSQQDLPGRS